MQNSAISLALCLEDKYAHIDEFNRDLGKEFKTEIIPKVSLFTVRNADTNNTLKFYENKTVLLEQISKRTIQMVIQ